MTDSGRPERGDNVTPGWLDRQRKQVVKDLQELPAWLRTASQGGERRIGTEPLDRKPAETMTVRESRINGSDEAGRQSDTVVCLGGYLSDQAPSWTLVPVWYETQYTFSR